MAPERTPARSPLAQPQQPDTADQIFISYRRVDSADVSGRIYDRLVQRFGEARIFKDVDSIPLGVDFREHLDQMVAQTNAVLVMIGPSWIEADQPLGQRRIDDPKDFVRIEIESALARQIPVIPLLVGGASIPAEDQLPASLRDLSYRNGVPIRPDPDFHRDMDRLIASLEKHFDESSSL